MKAITTSLAPWLTVRDSKRAVAFYKSAFDAVELYRFESPEGDLVAKLSIDGAEFWVSNEVSDNSNPELLGGGTVRMILTVQDPDAVFEKALNAGATRIFNVGEDHGWRIGRLADPFGLNWEIGKPVQSEHDN
jgi:PhnB protein